jgi:hypothetical protein
MTTETASRQRRRRSINVTKITAVAGLSWFFLAGDGADQLDARTLGRSRLDDPVIAWFEAMRSPDETAYANARREMTNQAANRMRTAILREHRARGVTTREWKLRDALANDPMVWANVVAGDIGQPTPPRLRIEVVDGDHARISLSGGFVARWARSGCLESDDAFTVVRRDSGWRINALPRGLFRGNDEDECAGESLEMSWRPVHGQQRGVRVLDTDVLPRWAGDRIQVANPVIASAVPESATALTSASTPTLPREAIDPEDRSGPPGGISAWRTRPGAALGTQIAFELGAPVRLARVRLFNGASNRAATSGYRRHGRIAAATIITDHAEVATVLPDTPELVTIDCDFGVTTMVRVRVDSVYPGAARTAASSDVALSDAEFWGLPPAPRRTSSAGSAVASSVAPPRHLACP